MLEGGNQIVEEMQKLAAVTRETTDNINEIAGGADQITDAVEQVSNIARKNKESIGNLAAEVNKFTV